MKKLLASFILMLLCGPAFAKSLYVNNSGSPACSDSTNYATNDSSNPWCTIGRAAWGSTSRSSPNTDEAASAGDTVYVTAGTYTGNGTGNLFQVLYNPANSGTDNNTRIVFQAVGLVKLVTTPTGGPIIGADGKNYITWDGFYIDDTESAHIAGEDPMVMFHSSNYGTLQNSTLVGHTSSETDANFCGVACYSATGCRIYNNDISNVVGADTNSAAIFTYEASYSIFEHNNISNSTAALFIKGRADMNPDTNNVYRYNKAWNLLRFGARLGGSSGAANANNLFYQNIFHGSTSSNMWGIFQNGNSSYTGNSFVNNTLYNVRMAWNYRDTYSGEPIIIYNNIIHTATVGVAYSDFSAPPVDHNYQHNSYYNVPSGTAFVYSPSASWTTWTTTWGLDTTSPASTNGTDPLLANPTDNDFRLCTASGVPHASCTGASPALTLGVDILDLDGDSSTTDTIPAGAYVTGSETIGTISGDTTPDSFSWNNVTGSTRATLITSDNTTSITGMVNGTTISISGSTCLYSIDGGAYTYAIGTIDAGQLVVLRVTSSSAYNTPVSCSLTVGTSTVEWTVTTETAPTETPKVSGGCSISGGVGFQ